MGIQINKKPMQGDQDVQIYQLANQQAGSEGNECSDSNSHSRTPQSEQKGESGEESQILDVVRENIIREERKTSVELEGNGQEYAFKKKGVTLLSNDSQVEMPGILDQENSSGYKKNPFYFANYQSLQNKSTTLTQVSADTLKKNSESLFNSNQKSSITVTKAEIRQSILKLHEKLSAKKGVTFGEEEDQPHPGSKFEVKGILKRNSVKGVSHSSPSESSESSCSESEGSVIVYKLNPTLQNHLTTNFQRKVQKHSFFAQLQAAFDAEQKGSVQECKKLLIQLTQDLDQELDKHEFKKLTQEATSRVIPQDIKVLLVLQIQTLAYLAIVQTKLGSLYEGLKNFEKCLRNFQINDDLLLSKLYFKAGQNAFLLLNFQKSLENFQSALNLQEKNQWKQDLTQTLLYIALIYAHLSFYEVAKKIAFASLSMIKERSEVNDIQVGIAYHFIGEIYNLAGENEQAIDFLETSLEIKQLFDEQTQILTLNKIANILHLTGKKDQALEKYEEAISLLVEQNSLTEAQLLNNLGLLYCDLGDMDNAKQSFQKALKIFLVFFYPTHSSVKRVMQNLELIRKQATD